MRRDKAILRGLQFIYGTACDADNFGVYGFDYVFCLHWISATSRDAILRTAARRMAVECARRWRAEYRSVPEDADADTVAQMVFGGLSADQLGVRNAAFKRQVRRAAAQLPAGDLLWFDPSIEPPPKNIPADCECGATNMRTRKICRACRKPLKMMSRYEVWLLAIIRSYLGERYGVKLGARYAEVIKWLPSMRPYPGIADNYDDFIWAIYAVTHIVYTLNGYSSYKLSPRWLPEEYEVLKASLDEIVAMEDPDATGEILDSLKSFGLTNAHPLIRKGTSFLLSTQNPDGSWGPADADDVYNRYHPTLTAINGLRDYSWSKTALVFPGLEPLLRELNIASHS